MSDAEVCARIADIVKAHPGSTSKSLPGLYSAAHGGILKTVLLAAFQTYKAAQGAEDATAQALAREEAAGARSQERQAAESDLVYHHVGEIMRRNPDFGKRELLGLYRAEHGRVDNVPVQNALRRYRSVQAPTISRLA